MRVIIRFSIDGDDGSLTTSLKNILKKNDLPCKKRTGTYEASGASMDAKSLKDALNEFWDKIDGSDHAKLDHFWMYVDKRTVRAVTRTQSQRKSSSRKQNK